MSHSKNIKSSSIQETCMIVKHRAAKKPRKRDSERRELNYFSWVLYFFALAIDFLGWLGDYAKKRRDG